MCNVCEMAWFEVEQAIFDGAGVNEYRGVSDAFAPTDVYALLARDDFGEAPRHLQTMIWSAWESMIDE